MKYVTVYDVVATRRAAFADRVEFAKYQYPRTDVYSEDGATIGALAISSAEPIIQVRVETHKDGTTKDEFFVMSTALREVLHWHKDMRRMHADLDAEHFLRLQERDRANALYRGIEEFNSMPWYRRVIQALKGGL